MGKGEGGARRGEHLHAAGCVEAKSRLTSGVWKAPETAAETARRVFSRFDCSVIEPDAILARDVWNSLSCVSVSSLVALYLMREAIRDDERGNQR